MFSKAFKSFFASGAFGSLSYNWFYNFNSTT